MNLNNLSHEELENLLHQLKMVEEYEKYNKKEYFSPYPYQEEMFGAGKFAMSRFACLANRIGKTHAGGFEMSCHLTGEYPEWWTGHKFTRPIKAWAIGITNDSTRKALQDVLLGTIDVRQEELVGTGAIPRNAILMDAIEKEGPTAKVVRVIWKDTDEYSVLEFRSTQQGVHSLMGVAQDYIWLDEESPHNSNEIFSQCSTRLATTKGIMLITATPENGLTPLIQKFYDNEDLFIFHAGWDDCPHLDEETKKKLLATYSEWEVECRTKGIPSKGSGAIFQVNDSDIAIPEWTPPDDWRIVAGIDFGRSRDASTIVFCAKDPDSDEVRIFHEEYLDQDRSPENMARIIVNSPYPRIPIVPPNDGNSVSTDGGSETRAAIMRRFGAKVIVGTFSNPPEVQNTISNVNKKHIGKEGGLAWMAYMMKNGTLKVCNHLENFFREKRSYFYITKGGRTQPKDGNDHVIDAARIAVLSVGRYGTPAGMCKSEVTKQDWNNGFNNEPLNFAPSFWGDE